MRAQSAIIQGALALVGLGAAYLTWQRPAETVTPGTVQVVSATRQSLEQVRFEDGTRFIELERKAGAEPRLWVTIGFLPGKAPVSDGGVPDGGVDGGAALASLAPPPPPPGPRRTPANERADTVFARYTPLDATRGLGSLDAAKREELGLAGSERRLALTVSGQVRRFIVSRPQPGLIGTYIEDEGNGQVYLVPGSVVTELDPASQALVDRRFHTFKQSEFDAFTVKVGESSARFVQTGADVPQTAKVARADTPDTPDELARNWHDKVWNRLVVTDVLGEGEVPRGGEPKVLVRVDYTRDGAPKGWLEVGTDPTGGVWARSENTVSWVSVHQGSEEIALEARKLVQ